MRVVVAGCESGLAVSSGVPAAGEDSDYYTPEDPATTILSPLHSDKVLHTDNRSARCS